MAINGHKICKGLLNQHKYPWSNYWINSEEEEVLLNLTALMLVSGVVIMRFHCSIISFFSALYFTVLNNLTIDGTNRPKFLLRIFFLIHCLHVFDCPGLNLKSQNKILGFVDFSMRPDS